MFPLRYVGMILFRIENLYFYGLRIIKPQFHRLEESHIEILKELKLQKTLTLTESVVLSVNMLIFWDCLIKQKNDSSLARWSYHYHLSKLTCTTLVTV